MDIVKISTEWAKDEMLSAKFFFLVGIMFVFVALGFWQFGKTDVGRAFIYPMLVAGLLLSMAGVGFFISNNSRISNFETEYNKDASFFVRAEIARAERTMGEYDNIAFRVFPGIIIVAALLIIFVNIPIWRAIGITTIAVMTTIVLLDSIAHARMADYHKKLLLVNKKELHWEM